MRVKSFLIVLVILLGAIQAWTFLGMAWNMHSMEMTCPFSVLMGEKCMSFENNLALILDHISIAEQDAGIFQLLLSVAIMFFILSCLYISSGGQHSSHIQNQGIDAVFWAKKKIFHWLVLHNKQNIPSIHISAHQNG